MEKRKALNILDRQLQIINNLKSNDSNLNKWKRDTEIAIEKIFGSDTRHISDFNKITYSATISYKMKVGRMTINNQKLKHKPHRNRGLKAAQSIIESFIQEIQEYWDKEEVNSNSKLEILNTTEKIELICNRFHQVARQMRSRYANRPTLEINDEYDVQDLFHSLLTLYFDDIRREESNPSYAGANSRSDFLLKPEKTIIEIKKTREGLNKKQVGEELTLDIQKYQTHPNCKTLVCFVYDPEGRINNPRGLESDLEQATEKIKVKVFIGQS